MAAVKDAVGTARTYVRDMLFRRTRIQVVRESELSEAAGRPVFLLGCFRSGTSLTRYILDSHPSLNCPPETKVLVPMAEMYSDPKYRAGLMGMGFGEEWIRDHVRGFFERLHVGNMVAHGKRRWVDKTPDYVTIIPFLEWLYGDDAQFVLIYRHGLDVARSMARMESGWIDEADTGDIDAALAFWIQGCRNMRALEERRPDQCFSFRYEDLCEEQDGMVRRILGFLDEPWDERVMRWYRQGHEEGQVDRTAHRTVGFRPSTRNWRKLPLDVQRRLMARAAPMLRELGYSVDQDFLERPLPEKTPGREKPGKVRTPQPVPAWASARASS